MHDDNSEDEDNVDADEEKPVEEQEIFGWSPLLYN
jgi:hypothetical protein